MLNRVSIAALVALAGLAAPALAQDSVSRNSDGGNGLPGDALSPWTTGMPYQRAQYVADLAPLTGSWGTAFGIAPVIKTSKTSPTFFNSLLSAHAMSATLATGRGYASPSYSLWTAPAGGVHPTENDLSLVTSVSPAGLSTQFAVGLAEFATDTGGVDVNNIITGVVNFDPAAPGRLYVTRVVSAVNESGPGAGDSAQFGFGGVDALGNTHLRADDLGLTGSNPIREDNLFRVRALSRAPGVINRISDLGGADFPVTDWLLVRSTTVHNTPTILGEDLAGRPVMLGSNFGTQYVYESTAGALTGTTAHRPGATDHRGAVSFSKTLLRPGAGAVGTSAMLSQVSGDTNSISVWGVAANGAPVNAVTLTKPATVSDTSDSFSMTGKFGHYFSQTAYRGGNGPVAMGQVGDTGFVAAVVYDETFTGADAPANSIVVGRFNPANPAGTVQWALAGWNTASLSGKPILGDYGADGVAGTGDAGEFDGVVDATDAPVGRMAALFEIPGAPLGPSISAPGFDSKGNLYFVAAVGLKKADGFVDFDTALLRAIYDPATFTYSLELIAELGDSFAGPNSGTRYQIQFIGIADSNSIDSGTFWSGNMT